MSASPLNGLVEPCACSRRKPLDTEQSRDVARGIGHVQKSRIFDNDRCEFGKRNVGNSAPRLFVR